MREEKKVNLNTYVSLLKCLTKWQTIFELNDWEIQILSNNDIDCKSLVTINGVNKQAIIKIITYDEYLDRDFNNFHWDMEESIVHELLHIMFVDLERAMDFKTLDKIDFFMESLVETLARKYLELERSRNVANREAEN